MDQENQKIVLTRIGKTACIFNVDDFVRLRREFKIVGSVVGRNCVNFRVIDGKVCLGYLLPMN